MVEVEGVNDDIVAIDDAVAVGEGQTSVNLWSSLKGNDQDVDNGVAEFRILAVDASGAQGNVVFDAAKRILTYSAAGIDLAPGETMTDSFTYTVTDGDGSTDTATVTVTVTGAENGGLAMSASDGGDGALLAAFLADGETETFADSLASLCMSDMIVADMPTL